MSLRQKIVLVIVSGFMGSYFSCFIGEVEVPEKCHDWAAKWDKECQE